MLGDSEQLSRAIANLAENATRHAATTVVFDLQQVRDHAVLTVTDDGSGIHPDHHEQVFERFLRLDTHRASSAGGSGLGLAIARDIALNHGGTLSIDPTYNTGARFVLCIPIA